MNHTHSPGSMTNTTGPGIMPGHHTTMHMTFFWGKNAEILFSGWPGYDHLGMYLLALVFVFCLAVIIEWLSSCILIKESTRRDSAWILNAGLYGLKIALAYMVMLAVMSFNLGVFFVAVSGHSLGFLVFSTRVFKKS